MIPKQNRISRNKFQNILRSGKVLRGVYVTAHAVPSPQPRLGIVVPKKKIKQASTRNRIRRVLYGLYQDYLNHQTETAVFSLVLRVHAQVENEGLFKKDVIAVLDKLHAN